MERQRFIRTHDGIWINIDYIYILKLRRTDAKWFIYCLCDDPEDGNIMWDIEVYNTQEAAQKNLDQLMNNLNGFA